MDFTKSYSFLLNIFVKPSKKKLQEKGVDTNKPYDFRDWDEIEA